MADLETENAHKRLVDGLASKLLKIDTSSLKRTADEIGAWLSKHMGGDLRIVVSGGTGANKSTVAKFLGQQFDIPSFDLDEYIEGGYDPDLEVYQKRLTDSFYRVYQAMPTTSGWLLEHVLACSPSVVNFFKPNVAILLTPPVEQLIEVANARDMVGEDTKGQRAVRSVQTANEAQKHWRNLNGVMGFTAPLWSVQVIK
jgi:hypothetical protein